MADRDPDLTPESSFALGSLGIALVVVAHLGAWFLLMLARPSGGTHRTTAWTVLFFVPEAFLVAGALAGALVRGPGGRIFGAAWLASVASLGLVVYACVSDPARRWSLPVVRPFGG